VNLPSGGAIVIDHTEALTAIDVNSARSTRGGDIETTAYHTNLEAADEIARQLRLRDLAGLIVIDFIDMEEKRNNRSVEKRLKDCLKYDRARIQVGRISHFGLLEMSRQRIRASVLESTMQVCEHCGGTGHVRSPSSVALHVLRTAEEYLLRNTKYNITLRTRPETALYVLNHKRDTIRDLEERFGLTISVDADPLVGPQMVTIDQGEPVENPVVVGDIVLPAMDIEPDVDIEEDDFGPEEEGSDSEADGRRRKRRRRKRGGRGVEGADRDGDAQQSAPDDGSEQEDAAASEDGEAKRKRRRRGKRGGRRNRESEDNFQQTGDTAAHPAGQDEQPGGTTESIAAAEISSGQEIVAESTSADSTGNADDRTHSVVAISVEQEETVPAGESSKNDEEVAPVAAGASGSDATGEDATEVPEDEKPARSRRRRSASTDAIASEPVLTSTAGDKEEAVKGKPKKVGWWQKRGFL
jgi:ribonuclease E